MSQWRVLLTRPADDCAALAAILAENHLFGSCMPLLAIEPLTLTATQLDVLRSTHRYSAVIVVSKPAARLAIDQLGAEANQSAWFSVGAATAAVLQEHGLRVTYPETADDSEALLNLAQLRTALQTPQPRVLIIRGEGGREALAEHLRAQGVAVDYLQLYRRCLPQYAAGALSERIDSERLNGLVVSSGQGLQHLQELAGEQWSTLRSMPLFVPSPRVAEMARAAGARNVVDCRGASAAALLTALREHAAPHRKV